MSLLDDLLRLDGLSPELASEGCEVSRALQELENPDDMKGGNWSQNAPTQGT